MNSYKLEERNESSDILQDVLQKTAERVENLKLIWTKRLNPIAMTKFSKTPVLKMWLNKIWLNKLWLKALKMLTEQKRFLKKPFRFVWNKWADVFYETFFFNNIIIFLYYYIIIFHNAVPNGFLKSIFLFGSNVNRFHCVMWSLFQPKSRPQIPVFWLPLGS